MTDAPAPEAAILTALGINPALVQTGSVKIHYDGEPNPILTFTLVQRVPAADLAKAMNAAFAEGNEPTRPRFTDVSLLPDGCHGEHDPVDNENCSMRPLDALDPVVQRQVQDRVNAELQRLASEKDQ